MGNSLGNQCFTRHRESGSSCCDLQFNNSVFGEDAFYRDADTSFYDCNEGNKSHDSLFAAARAQTRLKYKKFQALASYSSFGLMRKGSTLTPMPDRETGPGTKRPSSLNLMEEWVGKTIPEWPGQNLPETGQGPYWSRGDGQGLKVRWGPDYRKNGHKKPPVAPPMYEAVSCDAIRGDVKVENVVTDWANYKLPPPPEQGESDRGGGSGLQWTSSCPLPRVICINMMLPHTTGVVPMRKDAGCSFVGFFHITPRTIRECQKANPSPEIRLFMDFWDGPAGEPGGPHTNPDRSLFSRVDKSVKKDKQAGLIKAIAHCVNPEDVHVPEMFHTYNGKPCLITKCGYVIKDPQREWMEIGIDVRGFNILARRMLCSFRTLLPRTKIHYGFLVQGVDDEELPEGLICDMFVHSIDMMVDPVELEKAGC